MTTSSASPPSVAKPLRQPFALRELFSLVTLSGILAAIIFASQLYDSERWLLGLSSGGALLGMLVGRLLKGRGWLLGLLGGGVGAAAAMVILHRTDWERLEDISLGRSADKAAELWWELLGAGAAGIVLGLFLSVLTMLAQRFAVWSFTSNPSGLLGWSRRRPRLAAGMAALAASAVVAWWNIDWLIDPRAWKPKQIVQLQYMGRPITPNPSFMHVALSRHGEWLAVSLSFSRFDDNRDDFDGMLVYHLGRRIAPVELAGTPTFDAGLPAFDCESDQLACLIRDPARSGDLVDFSNENRDSSLRQRRHLRVHDLAADSKGRTLLLPESVDALSISDCLAWLPGQRIAVDRDPGLSVLDAKTGAVLRESDDEVHLDPRLGHAYRVVQSEVVQIVDLDEFREMAHFRRLDDGWTEWIHVSRDRRFAVSADTLYDLRRESRRELPETQFWTFTSAGQAVHSRNAPILYAFAEIPFWGRVRYWRNRDRVRLIDPASGEQLACTQPVWGDVLGLAISYDGSTLAAVTWEGLVYIYEVPEEYR